MNIFFCDSSPERLERFLEQWGQHKVTVATNPLAAIDIIESGDERFHIAFLEFDYHEPGDSTRFTPQTGTMLAHYIIRNPKRFVNSTIVCHGYDTAGRKRMQEILNKGMLGSYVWERTFSWMQPKGAGI